MSRDQRKYKEQDRQKRVSRRSKQHVPPVGECCGIIFYTWEGWHNHIKRHDERTG